MELMTKAERMELGKVARMNGTVAKRDLEAAGAEQLAIIEAQLATRYASDHAIVQDLVARAREQVAQCDAELAERCRKLGVPETFAPSIHVEYYARGENADKVRRAELRKAAEAAVDANLQRGKVKIDREVARICTELVSEGLTTEKARAFLASMPSIDELMPKLSLPQLEQTKTKLNDEERMNLRLED
jgi:hypothetical protein